MKENYNPFPYPQKISINLQLFRRTKIFFQLFSTLFFNVSIASIALLNGAAFIQGILMISSTLLMMGVVNNFNASLDISDVKIRNNVCGNYFQSITKVPSLRIRNFYSTCCFFYTLATIITIGLLDRYRLGSVPTTSFSKSYPHYLIPSNFYINPPSVLSNNLINLGLWIQNTIFNYSKIQLSHWNIYQGYIETHGVGENYLLLLCGQEVLLFSMILCINILNYSIKIEPPIPHLEKGELGILLSGNNSKIIEEIIKQHNNDFKLEYIPKTNST
jgi:hypothetical protein